MDIPQLSERLQYIASMVDYGARPADIGTDHGYIPVWLIKNRIVSNAIATDVHEGPLQRAEQTAARYQCADQIEFRLCDGLAGIQQEEVDTVIIAGMGGELIAKILSTKPWAHPDRIRYILQPMSTAEKLRTFLAENGYCIHRERIAKEEMRFYPVLDVTAGTMSLSGAEFAVGRQEPDFYDQNRKAYLQEYRRKLRLALQQMRTSSNAVEKIRQSEILDEEIGNMLNTWNSWFPLIK